MHAQLHFGSDGLQISNSFTQSYAASPQLYIRARQGGLLTRFSSRVVLSVQVRKLGIFKPPKLCHPVREGGSKCGVLAVVAAQKRFGYLDWANAHHDAMHFPGQKTPECGDTFGVINRHVQHGLEFVAHCLKCQRKPPRFGL